MDETRIIGRGKVGWHAQGITDNGSWSSSGGSLEEYARKAPAGTPVYDADGADESAFCRTVIAGPMCDPRLPGHAVDRFVARGEDEPLGALDSVSPARYVAILREQVPGVRLGTVRAGRVEWDA